MTPGYMHRQLLSESAATCADPFDSNKKARRRIGHHSGIESTTEGASMIAGAQVWTSGLVLDYSDRC